VEPVLWALLEMGRPTPASFDIQRAPLAAFLYWHLGEAQVDEAVANANRLFKGELDGPGFVATQPREVVKAVAETTSHLAVTRRDALLSLVRT
jgi:hypothetical protein